jgi:xylulokinase
LTTPAATLLGLAAGTPVYHGPGDAGAATLGAGCGEPGPVYAYLGTSGWVAFSAEDRGDPDQGVITLAHPQAGRFFQVAPVLTAGGNLDWVRALFYLDDYGVLIDSALAAPSAPLLYLPYLSGERSPFRDPQARGAFVGLSRSSRRSEIYRAVLEGMVFAYRHALDALLDAPPAALVMTGGGTRSTALCQLFADVTQTPVVIAPDPEHTGLRGAQLAAQVLSGERTDFALPDSGHNSAALAPDTSARAHYDAQYALFRQLYPALKPVFAAMAGTSA